MQNIIIGFFDLIKSVLDSLLPSMNSAGISEVSEAIKFFVTLISAADYLLPVTTIFTVTGIVMAYKLFMFGWWVVNWIIRTIRG